jgi:hypothetical protein
LFVGVIDLRAKGLDQIGGRGPRATGQRDCKN